MMCAGPWTRPPHYNVDAEDRQPIFFATSQHCKGVRGGVMGGVGGSGQWMRKQEGFSQVHFTVFRKSPLRSWPRSAQPLWRAMFKHVCVLMCAQMDR